MSDTRLQELKCIVLPGHIRDCVSENISHYNTAYDFWRVFMGYEMSKENIENIESKLSSDGFMLFEDIYTLFYKTSIVGLFCFDTKDMSSHAIGDQSFFKTFPVEILNNYVHKAQYIMTIGHLLVHPNWRRSKIGLGLSDILVWFMHKRFVESGCDLMLYWTRNNRSTNQLGIKFGGECILSDYHYSGSPADVIATRPDKVIMDSGDETVNQISADLWNNRICAHK